MRTLKPKHANARESKHMEEVFLMEALGRRSACDVGVGKKRLLLAKGSPITPHTIGLLAERGIDRVRVYNRPRISIIAIGGGLIPSGTSIARGQAYDPNVPMLRAALESMRIRPVFVKRLMNKPVVLKKVLSFALKQSDIVILLVKDLTSRQDWLRGLMGESKAPAAPGEEAVGSVALKKGKMVFCLPNDFDFVSDYFYKNIRPVIGSFLGNPSFAAS